MRGVKALYQIVFLDMDGTLRDEACGIPRSAITAINMCREKGCMVCLCTGRTLGTVTEDVRELGLDGIIAGGGSYIEFHGLELKNSSFAAEKWKLLNPRQRSKIQSEQKITYEDNMTHFQHLKNLVSKLCLWSEGEIYEETELLLQKEQIHLAQHWPGQKYHYYEIVQKGCDKGTALRTLCSYLKIPPKDVIAFGDGSNDIDMLQEAGTAVVMENAGRDVYQYADSICECPKNHGIYLEMQRRNII